MPGGQTPLALGDRDWDDSEAAEVVQSSAPRPRVTLRKRTRSLKQPRLPPLQTTLADELHMRFWSLEHGPGSQGSSDAGVLQIKYSRNGDFAFLMATWSVKDSRN